MGRRALLLAVVGALVAAAPAASADAPAPLLRAVAKTAKASSLRLSMRMVVGQGSKQYAIDVAGFERPKARQLSMTMDFSQLDPTIGKLEVRALGPRYYLHYGFLDSLSAKRPEIKPWVTTTSKAAVGFDPWTVGTDVRPFSRLVQDVHSVGGGRYVGSLDFRRALAANPQLQQLLGRTGGAASTLPGKPVRVELDVDADGYLARMRYRLSMSVAGQRVSTSYDLRMSGFGDDAGEVTAPPADQVMTLAAFKRLVHG